MEREKNYAGTPKSRTDSNYFLQLHREKRVSSLILFGHLFAQTTMTTHVHTHTHSHLAAFLSMCVCVCVPRCLFYGRARHLAQVQLCSQLFAVAQSTRCLKLLNGTRSRRSKRAASSSVPSLCHPPPPLATASASPAQS